MKKLIINLAPTGMIPTKEMTPHVPITTEEIVKDVDECAKLGVSMVHLHAREGTKYSTTIRAIRKIHPELIIVVSTSGRHHKEFKDRSRCLDLSGDVMPDMASLTLGSINFNKDVSHNSPQMIQDLAKKMKDKGIKPELEVFDLGMVNYAHYLIKKGLLEPPHYFNVILGGVATAQAQLDHAGVLLGTLPEGSIFSLGGIGSYQYMVNAMGVVLADGVRVGLEDNIWVDEARTRLITNIELTANTCEHSEVLGRDIATPKDVRAMLEL